GTVKSLESLPQVELHPNVRATISWGTGVMLSMLELAPHTEIPEEVLPADRFVFVLEGSISQLINGTPVTMISRDREEPDGINCTTPRTDFLYLEEGARSAVIAGDSVRNCSRSTVLNALTTCKKQASKDSRIVYNA